jgi:hypothetical protein
MRLIASCAALLFIAAVAAPSVGAIEFRDGAFADDGKPSISERWIESNRFGGNDRD